MEVLVGPTYGIDVTSSQAVAFVADRISNGDKVVAAAAAAGGCLLLKGEEVTDQNGNGSGSDSSDSSSSIGAPGESEESDDEEEKEEDDDDVSSSKVKSGLNGSLASLGSLEDSLPIKRGLSNYYAGRSKSFANLLDVSSVKDLVKAESPFNKRRRVLMANKWSRRSSFYSWQNPKSMPLLSLKEDNELEDEYKNPSPTSSSDDKEQELEERVLLPPKLLHHRKLKPTTTFKSQSYFSLADLQESHQ
ncbi:hypothetical protein CFOL_v3_21346 [Cephalotus follicularis]|uniref:Uncharacterized protein n=1 Tax=Cephalotus follicularis TaxID=3775 RepID=A0A1Q3CCN6_CEPFO|nr:hypothetical protein CFOL_v3_21346 [Cephalotus follicularis]